MGHGGIPKRLRRLVPWSHRHEHRRRRLSIAAASELLRKLLGTLWKLLKNCVHGVAGRGRGRLHHVRPLQGPGGRVLLVAGRRHQRPPHFRSHGTGRHRPRLHCRFQAVNSVFFSSPLPRRCHHRQRIEINDLSFFCCPGGSLRSTSQSDTRSTNDRN